MSFKLSDMERLEDTVNQEIKHINKQDAREYLGCRFVVYEECGVEVQVIVTARGEDFLMPEDDDNGIGLIGVELFH